MNRGTMNREQLQQEIQALYRREHEELGEIGTLRQLEEARQWNLAPTLAAGGVIVFPHAGVEDCGHQIAAAVHACLDSGADRVIVISVLHAFTDEMEDARVRVAAGEPPANFRHWGIQGTGLSTGDEWRGDHALYSFRHFWAAETKRRGIQGPEVIERYPYLAGGKPEQLPGIDELAALLHKPLPKSSVFDVCATRVLESAIAGIRVCQIDQEFQRTQRIEMRVCNGARTKIVSRNDTVIESGSIR